MVPPLLTMCLESLVAEFPKLIFFSPYVHVGCSTPWKPSNENLGSHIPIVLTIDLITRIIGCEAKTLAPSAKSHAKAYIMLLKLVS